MQAIVLFDGVCHFCDASVQFIIKRDPAFRFKFASLQSDIGKQLLQKHGVSKEADTFVLIHKDKAYTKSSAALKVCQGLKMPWKLLALLLLVPRGIRDYFYQIVARNRYRWFGQKEACTLPDTGDKERFLENGSDDAFRS